MNPLISIIVPVYNAQNYLPKLIASIKRQTFSDWECILVDDQSTDNSYKIIENEVSGEKRFQILQNEKNSHIAITQNRGMKAAKGRYLTFCDNDDYYDDEYLAQFVDKMQIGEYDIMIGSGWREVDENYNELFIKHNYGKKAYLRFVPQWNKFYKRSFIKENNIRFTPVRLHQDTIFNIVSISWAKSIGFVKTKSYCNHLLLHSSISHTQHQKQKLKDLFGIIYEINRQSKPEYRHSLDYIIYIIKHIVWTISHMFAP